MLPMAANAGGPHTTSAPIGSATSWIPVRAEDLVYVHYNRRCVLKSRELEQFASWLDEDVQLRSDHITSLPALIRCLTLGRVHLM